jgi:hypothetical protein
MVRFCKAIRRCWILSWLGMTNKWASHIHLGFEMFLGKSMGFLMLKTSYGLSKNKRARTKIYMSNRCTLNTKSATIIMNQGGKQKGGQTQFVQPHAIAMRKLFNHLKIKYEILHPFIFPDKF